MMIESETWKQLIAFTKRHVRAESELSPRTELLDDLDLDGDDAFDFMEAFAEEFSVRAGDFEFIRYFSPEGFNPFEIVFSLFRRQSPKHPLTLLMLAKAIELGKLDTKAIEEANDS